MQRVLPIVFMLFLAGATYYIKERRASTPMTPSAPFSAPQAIAPSNDREAWAVDFLKALGNDQPSAETVGMVVSWTLAEDGSDGAMARNNPLNTTICGHNWTGAINGDGACGVGGYATYQDGIDAAVDTIDQANFSAIMIALQANDAEGAKHALWESGWASSHYCNGGCWPAYRMEDMGHGTGNDLSPAQASATGGAYMLQGDVGVNVTAALNANGGALMGFTIQPGETWSFGHSIAPISAMGPLVYAGGVYGGGFCDLSAEYLKVAQQLGLEVHYVQHAGVSTPFPSIWLSEQGDGESGQDLLITNTTSQVARFQTSQQDGILIVEGSFI